MLSLGLFCGLCACFQTIPGRQAWAQVLDTDIVAGKPMSERDLTVAQRIDIDSPYACMIDNDGVIYFERAAHIPVKIASMTKVMTAIVALEHSSSTDIVTVSERAATVGESSANLRTGDQMTMFSALCCMLIPSGNDAAMAVAETVGQNALNLGWDLGLQDGEEAPTDPVEAFVCLMNKKAAELGLEDTVFTNPHGLDDGIWEGNQHSTAYDVCLMAKCAMQFDDFRRIVRSTGATVDLVRDGETRQLYLTTTDWFLASYDYANGIKTGTTDLAGYCFVGSSQYLDLELYAVVLQAAGDDERFAEVQDMHVWGFLHRVTYTPINSSETVETTINGQSQTVPLFAEIAHPSWVDTTFKVYAENPDETLALFDVDGNVMQRVNISDITGDIHEGDVVGTVEFLQHNEVICTKNLIAAEDCPAPNMFQAAGVWFQRLKLTFDGKNTVALNRIVNEVPRIIDKTTA